MDILSDVKIFGNISTTGGISATKSISATSGISTFGDFYFNQACANVYGNVISFDALLRFPRGATFDGILKSNKIGDQTGNFLINFDNNEKSVILSSCYGTSINLLKLSEKQVVKIIVPTNCTGFYIGKTNSFPIIMGAQTDNGQLFKNVEMDYCINGQTVNCSDATEFLIYGQIQNSFSTPKTLMFSFM